MRVARPDAIAVVHATGPTSGVAIAERIDARERAHPLDERLVEHQGLCLGARSRNRRHDDVLRLESRGDVEHMSEAHEQQARADEQDQRQGESASRSPAETAR